MSARIIPFPVPKACGFRIGDRVTDKKTGDTGYIDRLLDSREGVFVFAALRMDGGKGRRVVPLTGIEPLARASKPTGEGQ